jgi:predicted dehydrogenase
MPPLEYLRSSGGQMRDQAIHFFDLLRFLTGDEVTTVAAMGMRWRWRKLPNSTMSIPPF